MEFESNSNDAQKFIELRTDLETIGKEGILKNNVHNERLET